MNRSSSAFSTCQPRPASEMLGQFGGACIGLGKAFVRPLDKEWSRAGHLRAKPPYRILGSKPHEKFSVRSSTGRYRKCLSPHLSASKTGSEAMILGRTLSSRRMHARSPEGLSEARFPFYSWAQGHQPNVGSDANIDLHQHVLHTLCEVEIGRRRSRDAHAAASRDKLLADRS